MNPFGGNARLARAALDGLDHRLRTCDHNDALRKIGDRLQQHVGSERVGNLQRAACTNENVQPPTVCSCKTFQLVGMRNFGVSVTQFVTPWIITFAIGGGALGAECRRRCDCRCPALFERRCIK